MNYVSHESREEKKKTEKLISTDLYTVRKR